MTPRLFDALRKRLERKMQREEFLTGTIAAQVANFSMAKLKQPFRPDDFIFTNPLRREDAKPQTAFSMLAAFDTAARLSSRKSQG